MLCLFSATQIPVLARHSSIAGGHCTSSEKPHDEASIDHSQTFKSPDTIQRTSQRRAAESVPQSRDINNTPSTACGVSNHYTHLRAPLIYHNVVDTDIVCTAEDWRSLDATSIIAVEKGGAWRDSTRNIKYQRLVRCLTNRDRGGIWRVLRSWQVRLSLFVIQSGIDRDTTFSWPARRVSWWSWVTDTS